MSKVLKFFDCDKCKSKFLCTSEQDKICDDCLGKEPTKVDGVPNLGQESRLGDNNFKGASKEWFDHLRNIKKSHPNSTIDVK